MTVDNERYNRQIMLPEIGPEGQAKLAAASVLIVGLGGLGSPVAVYLACAGVGRIGLCDNDTVSLSNLQRQTLYTTAQIGMPKTEAARERLAEMVPELLTDVHPAGLDASNAENIIRNYDLVVDCCDNFATRYLIDDVCSKVGKTWVYGSIGAFNGQLAVMNGKAGVRYSHLFPDRQNLCARPRITAGVLGSVPGVVGTMQATEALKLLAGFGQPLDGRLLSIDLLTMQTETINF